MSEKHTTETKHKHITDEGIDLSDIPELDADELEQIATTPKKTRITTYIDSDVLEWLKSESNQYQTTLNAILKAYYLKSIGKH